MKKIIIIITILFTYCNTQAQTNYTPNGTWKWINGNDIIEFYFKTDSVYYGNEYIPIIIAFHKYIKNGQVIESSLSGVTSNYQQKLYSLYIPNTPDTNPKLGGYFKDITLNSRRFMSLKRLNSYTMQVNLMYISGVRLRRNNGEPYGFTLPRNFTLIKQ